MACGRPSQHHITPGGGLSSPAAVAGAVPPDPAGAALCFDAAASAGRKMLPSPGKPSRKKFGSFKCLVEYGRIYSPFGLWVTRRGISLGGRFGCVRGITEQYSKIKALSWIALWIRPVGAWWFFLILLISFSFFLSLFPLLFLSCASLYCLIRWA